jgi:hypothetical protein
VHDRGRAGKAAGIHDLHEISKLTKLHYFSATSPERFIHRAAVWNKIGKFRCEAMAPGSVANQPEVVFEYMIAYWS